MFLVPSGRIQHDSRHQIAVAQYPPYENYLSWIGKDPVYLRRCLEYPRQETLTVSHFRVLSQVVGPALARQDDIQIRVVQFDDLFDEVLLGLSDDVYLGIVFEGDAQIRWPDFMYSVGCRRPGHGKIIVLARTGVKDKLSID